MYLFILQVLFSWFMISIFNFGLGSYKSILLMILMSLSYLKLLSQRNHLLNYLILIEFYMVIMYCVLLSKTNLVSSSSSSIFFFMVIMVCGACMGMSLLVKLTRKMSKELELTSITY